MEQPPQPRRSIASRLVLVLLLALLLTALALVALLQPALSDQPTLPQPPDVSTNTTAQAKAFVSRSIKTLTSNRRYATLTANNQEINSLITLASRALPQLRGHANIDRQGIDYRFSLQLPKNPLGNYLSISGRIPPMRQGFDFGFVKIGHLELSNPVLSFLATRLVDTALGEGQGRLLLQSVKSVHTADGYALLHAARPTDLDKRVEALTQRFAKFSSDTDLFAHNGQMRRYFQLLVEQGRLRQSGENISLLRVIKPLFAEAARLSADGNPRGHNQAAILALGVYLGSPHFEKLTGRIRPADHQFDPLPYSVGLAGRQDLRLHFIFSAVFKVMADQGFSFAAGEYKELLDSGRGGSGFSFVDLAADRAGTRFADAATRDQHSARKLQQVLASSRGEEQIFPAVKDLPEGLNKARFDNLYGSLDSVAFRAVAADIDQRLNQLPLYQI